LKGLHDASEAIRGTVNADIAHGMHGTAEEERMREVREQGVNGWRTNGMQERGHTSRGGFREKAGEGRKLRKRSLSWNGVHGTEGPGGLEVVAER
jgi:hypothetical protein